MVRREPDPSASAGLEAGDPDRIAAALAQASRVPSVFVFLFETYGSREILQEALNAELKRVWRVRNVVVDLAKCRSRRSFLASRSAEVTWVVGIENVLDRTAPWLNALRDELASRHVVFWIPTTAWPDFARLAPDLASYAIVWEPALVGGVVPANRLQPMLHELERKWRMTTQEFIERRRKGELKEISDDEVHLWGSLADLLRRR
ncbi:MAG: hypothetical protein HYY17_09085 [Planctomycetes bacterium]|nr:hypothetical protein [Planctomycetota bacterium]